MLLSKIQIKIVKAWFSKRLNLKRAMTPVILSSVEIKHSMIKALLNSCVLRKKGVHCCLENVIFLEHLMKYHLPAAVFVVWIQSLDHLVVVNKKNKTKLPFKI